MVRRGRWSRNLPSLSAVERQVFAIRSWKDMTASRASVPSRRGSLRPEGLRAMRLEIILCAAASLAIPASTPNGDSVASTNQQKSAKAAMTGSEDSKNRPAVSGETTMIAQTRGA